jgi:hypothetical protein
LGKIGIMKRTQILIFIICIFFASCGEEKFNGAPITANTTIELVVLGPTEVPSEQNKGFGLIYYCYLNLENDSIFIQYREDVFESKSAKARAGTIRGLSKNGTILTFLDASKKMRNGNMEATNIPDGVLYCGNTYFTRLWQGNSEKYYLYTTHNLDERFEKATDLIMALRNNNQLRQVSRTVYEDNIIVPIINKEGFDFPPPPPPPIDVTEWFKPTVKE